MPKTKKTKKEGGKAKAAKKTTKKKAAKKTAKTKSKSTAKKTAKKAIKKSKPSQVKKTQQKKKVEEKKLSPEEEAAFASQSEASLKEEKSSGREELDRLIQQEALQDRVIFSHGSESGRGTEEDEDVDETGETVAKRAAAESEPPKLYVSQGEEVSMTRRILLWSSVAVCAIAIIFGWFLTIGGSLGLKEVEAEYPEVKLENVGDQIIDGLEEVRDNIQERNSANSQIEDNTLETIVNEIESSTSSDEAVGEPGRDIFNPATNTEEVIE